MAYQDPNFDKEKYWRNRKAGIRGQASDDQYNLVMAQREFDAKMRGEKIKKAKKKK